MSESSGTNDRREDEHHAGDSLRGGRYVVTGKLGQGGQATTFDAVDKREGRRVTLKCFRVRGASSWKEVELAEREAKVLAHLKHPNLPVYVDHFEEGGSLYLVTEHIEGDTLESLRGRGAVGEQDILRFLADAAEVLDYLHGRSPPIVHRDIKPSNVIRRPDGSFAIIDFGAVRDRLKSGGSTVVGTFGYMAPEQFQGRAMPASDVYAVGTTAIAMLTGSEPEDLPHKGLAIDVEAALGPRARPALVRALAAMVEPDPDVRAPRLAPLLGELRAAAAEPARRRQPRDGAGEDERRDGRDAGREERERRHGRSDGGPPHRPRNAMEEQAMRAVDEAEDQVRRVVGKLGEQVRRAVAEVAHGGDAGMGGSDDRDAERGSVDRDAERGSVDLDAERGAGKPGGRGDGRSDEERGRGGRRREAQRAAEVAKREAKRAAKRARREAKRDAGEASGEVPEGPTTVEMRPRGAPLRGPILAVVLLALSVAQLAVLLGLRVIAPAVLYVVSLLFFRSVPGKAMRAAARHVSATGTWAAAAIGRAKDVVRGRAPEEWGAAAASGTPAAASEDGVRARFIDDGTARRIDDGAGAENGDEEEEAAAEEEASGKDRRRAR